MNIKKQLKNKKVIIATHIYTTGPAHALENYIKDKVDTLLFIGHPFVYAKERRSHYRFYKKGKLIKEFYLPITPNNQIVSLFKDFFFTLYAIFTYGRFDLFIGVNSANACIAVLMKWIWFIKKNVYYTIDYVPNRVENNLLNSLYHAMDIFAVKQSNYVWNLSEIMVFQREKKGVGQKYRSKQIVVPIGTENILSTPSKKFKKYHIAHMGHIIKKQGVQLLIDAIPFIVKKIKTFHLEIIGGGEYEEIIKKKVIKMKLSKYVTFHGYVKTHEEVAGLLSYCELGIAPYVDTKDNYVRYTDPGKVKAYLAAGLPVVITKVPEVYKYLEEKKSGIAVPYVAKDLAEAITKLLLDRKKLQLYKKNALVSANEFTWDKIFDNALEQAL